MKNEIIFERLNDNNLEVVKGWFNIPSFYFDTHEPDKIPMKKIDFILKFHQAHYLVIKYLENPVGLMDFILENEASRASFELAFREQKYWKDIGESVVRRIVKHLFLTYPIRRVEKWVYEFDTIAAECLTKSGLQKEGTIRSILLKNGKYYNVDIYAAYRKKWV